MLDGLGCLVHLLVRASPIQDPHPEQAKEDWIIDVTPINLYKPLSPLDHVHPEPIIKIEVWVHVPLPPVVNDCLVVQFSSLHNPMEGILGNLSNFHQCSIKEE